MYLIVGGDSLIGKELVDELNRRKKLFFFTSRRKIKKKHNQIFLDLNYPKKINLTPKTIVMCTGNSKLKMSKFEKKKFYNLHIVNTIKFLKQFDKKTRIIFLSSDSVFEGSNKSSSIYSNKKPLSDYAKQKDFMEEELKRHDFNYTIIRITKVVSVNIKLFENWIKKIKLNHSIRVYGNYYFSPISTKYLVNNILKIKRKGIFHLSNQKSLSYYQFLKLLINKIDKRKKILIKKIYSDVHNSKTLKLKMPNKLKNYGIKPQNIKSTIKDLLNQI